MLVRRSCSTLTVTRASDTSCTKLASMLMSTLPMNKMAANVRLSHAFASSPDMPTTKLLMPHAMMMGCSTIVMMWPAMPRKDIATQNL